MKKHQKTLAMLCALATATGSLGASFPVANAEAVLAQPPKAPVITTGTHFTDCRKPFELLTLDKIPNNTGKTGKDRFRCAPSASEITNPSESYIPLLLIAVSFEEDETQEYCQIDVNDDISDRYFKNKDSITSYYHEQSFGQFTFLPAKETSASGVNDNPNLYDAENDGVVHVKLDTTRPNLSSIPFYLDISEEEMEAYDYEYSVALALLLSEAVTKADEYVDFASYDADGDGTIATNELALGFVVAGQESAALSLEEFETVNQFNYFWAHAWGIEYAGYYMDEDPTPFPDGVKVSDYIAVPEYELPDLYEGMSTLAHELGHYIGLPDLYDTTYTETGEWSGYSPYYLSIMDRGGYCLNPETGEFLPSSFDIWSKWMLGWVDEEMADTNGTYTINATDYDNLDARATALVIPTQHLNEYYFLENRQDTKWDTGIAYGFADRTEDGEQFINGDPLWRQSGLILWHIDFTNYDEYHYYNIVNSADHHPAVTPLYGERINSNDNTSYQYDLFGEYASVATGFFSKEIWEQRYSEKQGAVLNLPVYGNGEEADLRDARWLSGITVEFLDNNSPSMQVEISYDNHVHYLEHYDAIPPTADEDGMMEYWVCWIDEKFYLDENGEHEVSYEDLIIPATGSTTTETTTTETTTTEAVTTESTGVSTTEDTGSTISTRPTEESTTTTETTTFALSTYSLEQLEDMAINDYEKKNGVRPDDAKASMNEDGTVTITLTKNEDGKNIVVAIYTVDPETGIGTDKNGAEVNLPQTGNNAPGTATAAAGAFVLVGTGMYLAMKSGVLRKKENE